MPRLSIEALLGIGFAITLAILDHLHVRDPLIVWGLFFLGLVLISDSIIRSDWARQPQDPKRRAIRRLGAMVPVAAIFGVFGVWIHYRRTPPIQTTQTIVPAQVQPTRSPEAPIIRPDKKAKPSRKVKTDNAVVRSITQGAGSIAQIGGSGNTATVTNNFVPPSRSISAQDRVGLVNALSGNKARGVVQYPVSDNEAANFAQTIYDILNDAGWDLPDKTARPIMLQGKFPPGVRIGFHGEVRRDSEEVEIDDRTIEGKVIVALSNAHVKNLYVNTRPELPEGTIEFIVASNPDATQQR